MVIMRRIDEIDVKIETINEDLRDMGDPARVRFAWVEPDSYIDDGWVLTAIWELPDYGDDPEGWPLETLQKYRRLLAAAYADDFDVLTDSLFRTAEDLADPAHQRGRRIPEPA